MENKNQELIARLIDSLAETNKAIKVLNDRLEKLENWHANSARDISRAIASTRKY